MSQASETSILRIRGTVATPERDRLAVERPLEIRAKLGGVQRVISTTMRTPGEDRALAIGFLFAERVIANTRWIDSVESVGEDSVDIEFAAGFAAAAEAALEATQRRFVTSAACGVCGRSTLDALMALSPEAALDPGQPRIAVSVVNRLTGSLRAAQATFAKTGGLHAAGLFTTDGVLQSVHEDVGRHNAVDKLVGTLVLEDRLQVKNAVLVVSGRASFELVQKAAVAGFPVMAAVGAPSSLAVEIATAVGMTLLGFVRDGGFNSYCGSDRLEGLVPPAPWQGRVSNT